MLAIRCLSRFAATGAFAMFLGLGGDPAEALYDVEPGEIAGKPGSIIRVWPLESGGPGNSDAFRFLYRSTGVKGEPIPVSGAIFIPSGPAPPAAATSSLGRTRLRAWRRLARHRSIPTERA